MGAPLGYFFFQSKREGSTFELPSPGYEKGDVRGICRDIWRGALPTVMIPVQLFQLKKGGMGSELEIGCHGIVLNLEGTVTAAE